MSQLLIRSMVVSKGSVFTKTGPVFVAVFAGVSLGLSQPASPTLLCTAPLSQSPSSDAEPDPPIVSSPQETDGRETDEHTASLSPCDADASSPEIGFPDVDSSDSHDDPEPAKEEAGSNYFDEPDGQGPVRLVASPKDESGELDHSDKLKRCQELIDYEFKDQELLQFALTHASGASHRLASNERLEFLGDSILGFVVCAWLFETYPEYSEGDLTKIKSAVVSRRTCGKVACLIGLDECLIVGRGVTRNRSYPRSLVSDVFESIIAAIYLDGGHDVVRERLIKWLADEVEIAVVSQGSTNYKSALQQRAQRDIACTPMYRLKREAGPDHRKTFLICAVIEKREFTAAWGTNKKEAEQKAAANALAELNDDPVPFPVPEDDPKPTN